MALNNGPKSLFPITISTNPFVKYLLEKELELTRSDDEKGNKGKCREPKKQYDEEIFRKAVIDTLNNVSKISREALPLAMLDQIAAFREGFECRRLVKNIQFQSFPQDFKDFIFYLKEKESRLIAIPTLFDNAINDIGKYEKSGKSIFENLALLERAVQNKQVFKTPFLMKECKKLYNALYTALAKLYLDSDSKETLLMKIAQEFSPEHVEGLEKCFSSTFLSDTKNFIEFLEKNEDLKLIEEKNLSNRYQLIGDTLDKYIAMAKNNEENYCLKRICYFLKCYLKVVLKRAYQPLESAMHTQMSMGHTREEVARKLKELKGEYWSCYKNTELECDLEGLFDKEFSYFARWEKVFFSDADAKPLLYQLYTINRAEKIHFKSRKSAIECYEREALAKRKRDDEPVLDENIALLCEELLEPIEKRTRLA